MICRCHTRQTLVNCAASYRSYNLRAKKKLEAHAIAREKNGKWKFRLESNGSPDTIKREISVLKGDVIATVPDPDLGMGGGGPPQFFFGPSGLSLV